MSEEAGDVPSKGVLKCVDAPKTDRCTHSSSMGHSPGETHGNHECRSRDSKDPIGKEIFHLLDTRTPLKVYLTGNFWCWGYTYYPPIEGPVCCLNLQFIFTMLTPQQCMC